MATKRMFDRAIIETDKFLDLPISAKAIYFLLGMEADDSGFVSSKRVMKIYGGNDDDITVLVGRGFLIPFENGLVVITHWHQNNWLDSRRTKETQYTLEKNMLKLTNNGRYVLSNGLASIEESRIDNSKIVNIKEMRKELNKKLST